MRASIIIAAHNEGEALWRTIRSCVDTSPGFDCEILVADDASTDGSVQEARQKFPRVRIVTHEARRGTSPTKDFGARHARGEVLVFLDGHCKPEHGALERLVRDVEDLAGQAIVTPAIPALDSKRWKNDLSQVGHGYRLNLETFDCGWLALCELRSVNEGRKELYESPALIGCVLAVSRQLYDTLWGFDPHMRFWGVEDLDFGLKCWLMGYRILHDPDARVGHRFRAAFDNYSVPMEHLVVNQLRMARKTFMPTVWAQWVDRCRQRNFGPLSDHPEGLWARAWQLFERDRDSVEQERAYLHAQRIRDEFWFAERFALSWPTLQFGPTILRGVARAAAEPAASPSPPPCKVTGVNPATVAICLGHSQTFTAVGTNLADVTWESNGDPPTGKVNSTPPSGRTQRLGVPKQSRRSVGKRAQKLRSF